MTALMLVGFVVAAPYGIAAVAAVHLVTSAAYALARLLVANRMIGSSLRGAIVTMRSGAAAGLPLGLAMGPGVGALLTVSIAATLAALAAAVAADRAVVTEVRR